MACMFAISFQGGLKKRKRKSSQGSKVQEFTKRPDKFFQAKQVRNFKNMEGNKAM